MGEPSKSSGSSAGWTIKSSNQWLATRPPMTVADRRSRPSRKVMAAARSDQMSAMNRPCDQGSEGGLKRYDSLIEIGLGEARIFDPQGDEGQTQQIEHFAGE